MHQFSVVAADDRRSVCARCGQRVQTDEFVDRNGLCDACNEDDVMHEFDREFDRRSQPDHRHRAPWYAFVPLVFLFAVALNAATVTRVINGDTIVVGKERVRLIGVDAPEIKHPGYPTDDCYGPESEFTLRSLITGCSVRLYRHGHDRHGRTLAYVFLTRDANASATIIATHPRLGIDSVNLFMIVNGYARADRRFNHHFSAMYAQAEAMAQQEKYGLWGAWGTCP